MRPGRGKAEKKEGSKKSKRRKKRKGNEKQEVASRTVCPGWPRREAGRGQRKDRASAKRRKEKVLRGERRNPELREDKAKRKGRKGNTITS